MDNNDTLMDTLCKIDKGRFKDLITAINVSETCQKCNSFNLAIKDKWKSYKCCCAGSCPAATLHPHLVSYLNWKLGWISENEHMHALGLSNKMPELDFYRSVN